VRTSRKLLFSLLPVVLLLVAAELSARLVGLPPTTSPASSAGGKIPGNAELDPQLGWRLSPGADGGDPMYEDWARQHGLPYPPPACPPINSRGMRDDELSSDKPPGQVRVYAMGDSSVFGSGVPFEQTFSQRLEQQLNLARGSDPALRPRAVEVINAGVPGYSSFQAMAMLERNLDLRPDVVIAYLMNSDLMEFRGSPDSVWFKRWYRGYDISLMRYSLVWRWLEWWRDDHRPRARSSDGMLLRVRVEHFRENLRGLASLGKRHGFSVVFVLPPALSDTTNPHEALEHRATTQQDQDRLAAELKAAERNQHWTGQGRKHFRVAMTMEARALRARLVDGPALFHEALRAEPERYRGGEQLFLDGIHPTAAGHALLAAALLPEVEAALAE
jgi:lysophospholipase L1-like esterase